jgi:hypothetical protein
MPQGDLSTALRTKLLDDVALVALLATSSSVFPDAVPEKEGFPAIAYEVLSDRREDTLEGGSQLRTARVQYDCHADDRLTADAIGRHVERILGGSVLAGVRLPETRDATSQLVEIEDATADNSYARKDPPRPGSDAWTYRRVVDFEVWYLHDAVPAE